MPVKFVIKFNTSRDIVHNNPEYESKIWIIQFAFAISHQMQRKSSCSLQFALRNRQIQNKRVYYIIKHKCEPIWFMFSAKVYVCLCSIGNNFNLFNHKMHAVKINWIYWNHGNQWMTMRKWPLFLWTSETSKWSQIFSFYDRKHTQIHKYYTHR